MPGATETIEHRVRVAAPPEVVFAYFTDPAKLVRWMGSEATLDPRPGGVCRIEIQGLVMVGRFEQVEFPSKLSFTWGWEPELLEVPPRSTTVQVSFTPDGDGTIVSLSHSRVPPGAVAFHTSGWRHYLERLVAAGQDMQHDGGRG